MLRVEKGIFFLAIPSSLFREYLEACDAPPEARCAGLEPRAAGVQAGRLLFFFRRDPRPAVTKMNILFYFLLNNYYFLVVGGELGNEIRGEWRFYKN